MIGAGDAVLAGALAVQQLGAAVAAGVLERAQGPVLAAHDDDGIAPQVEGREIAGLLHLVLVADELPGRQDHALILQLQQLRVQIGPGRQRLGLVDAFRMADVDEAVHEALRSLECAPISFKIKASDVSQFFATLL